MAGRKSDFTLPTNTLDELFSSQEERDEAKLSKIRDIPLEEIDDFPDHPFQVREDEDMFQLVESIKERGVITPATVRQKEDGRYLQIKYGEVDLSVCDSLENGVIVLYNRIRSKINADFDMLLDESDIDAILMDSTQEYDEPVCKIVREQAQLFIDDLAGKLRERMIDLRSGKTVFVGGGSILLKKQIEACSKIGPALFVDELSANTKGYELLYRASRFGG